MKLELRKPEAPPLEPALTKARLALLQSRGELANTTAKLERELSEHQAKLQSARMRCSRIAGSFRNLIEGGTIRCLNGDARQMANLVLAGADIETVVSDDRRHLESMYSAYSGSGSDFGDDLLLMKNWDFERGVLEVLKQAILLQKQSEATLRRSAMVQFARTLAEARGALARRFLAALKDAQLLMAEDSRITEGLGLQQEEVELIRPRPAPSSIPSFELIEWLFDMVTQKLIRAEDLSGLQLTAPGRDPRS